MQYLNKWLIDWLITRIAIPVGVTHDGWFWWTVNGRVKQWAEQSLSSCCAIRMTSGTIERQRLPRMRFNTSTTLGCYGRNSLRSTRLIFTLIFFSILQDKGIVPRESIERFDDINTISQDNTVRIWLHLVEICANVPMLCTILCRFIFESTLLVPGHAGLRLKPLKAATSHLKSPWVRMLASEHRRSNSSLTCVKKHIWRCETCPVCHICNSLVSYL